MVDSKAPSNTSSLVFIAAKSMLGRPLVDYIPHRRQVMLEIIPVPKWHPVGGQDSTDNVRSDLVISQNSESDIRPSLLSHSRKKSSSDLLDGNIFACRHVLVGHSISSKKRAGKDSG